MPKGSQIFWNFGRTLTEIIINNFVTYVWSEMSNVRL